MEIFREAREADISNPKVTVLMPVYNGERYLRRSIASILQQTFSDFEFLIVDDGSRDASRDIVLSFSDPRIRFRENAHNVGLNKTLNLGLALARGEYIARQDQDDISHPTRLQKQAACLDEHPEIVLLGTRVNNIDGHGRKARAYGYYIVSSEAAIRWQVMFDSPCVHSTVMMRLQTLRQTGGYDDYFKYCEDYDLFSRLAYDYKVTNLPEVLFDYRYHPGSMTPNSTRENDLLIGEIMRRSFQRCMHLDPPQEWINGWLIINNPCRFADEAVDIGEMLGYIESFYDRFVAIYPQARADAQIQEYISRMLVRIAYSTALKNRWASLHGFFRLCIRNVGLACVFLPQYLVAFILGRHRMRVSEKFRTYRAMVGIQ